MPFGPEAGNVEEREVGELYAINLDPRFWRQGLGPSLLAAVTTALRESGFRSAVLWVVPQNERARAVYEADGWVADGASREDEVLGVTVTDIRYRRTLETH